MSSDGYFDDDFLDQDALDTLDAIEAAHAPSNKPALACASRTDSYDDISFNIDASELEKLDGFIEAATEGRAQPVAGPSRSFTRTTSRATLQTTLFGDVLPAAFSANKPISQGIQRLRSESHNPPGQKAAKTKKWDHTQFAKSGTRKPKGKGKQKGQDYGEVDDEEEEFEQFPAPFIPVGPPPPMKLKPDLLEAKHWIFPLNRSKRDYQYNIVKRCLFENTLVALPTGLGKTFVAGVVMLNYYRWFPEGKIVFVAPTKPLVSQQIDACHQTCGIPGHDAVELTGENTRPLRAKAWADKRVFYMTPQTLLNDLQGQICDVSDIILLVIDEAHKATGDHAYSQVVRFLMAKNPHFRLLALTATPGGTPEKVQDLVDALHISHIEIRDENSLDLKPFIHEKRIQQHIIRMTDDINKIVKLLAQLMEDIMRPLKGRGVIYGGNVYSMHPFWPQSLMATLKPEQKWACSPLMTLSSLARAMGYLVEASVSMCYICLKDASSADTEVESGPQNKPAATRAKKLSSNPLFKALMAELGLQQARGFAPHPKMERLKMFLVQHFAERMDDEGHPSTDANGEETRAMVFVTFRECVEEIVQALNIEQPMLRACAFVGQGTDKQGRKGLAQKEQLAIIKKFKAGEFNVLVATSIGEEGLDIGEVDLIVCYDAQKTPIRMLQRVGRTGRKRAGAVHVLLGEGREETNFEKAKDAYSHVQKSIVIGNQLELYGDVERLIPDNVKPQCLERTMAIVEYVRDDEYKRMQRKKSDHTKSPKATKERKRKRDTAIDRNIPAGAIMGFLNASKLVPKKRKAIMTDKELEAAGIDGSSDLDIESGVIIAPPRRSQSACTSKPTSKGKGSKTKPSLRRAATAGNQEQKKAAKKPSAKKKAELDFSLSELSQKGEDDSDDLDIEQGYILRPSVNRPSAEGSRQSRAASHSHSPQSHSQRSHSPQSLSPVSYAKEDIIDLCSDAESLLARRSGEFVAQEADNSMAWLVNSSDDDMNICINRSSPRERTPAQPDDLFGGLDHSPANDQSCDMVDYGNAPSSPSMGTFGSSSSVARVLKGARLKPDMLPPALPSRTSCSSPLSEDLLPESSFPVGRAPKRRVLLFDGLSSPSNEGPPTSRRRLVRPAAQSQTHGKKPGRRPSGSKPKLSSRKHNPIFDMEAEHSGEEVSEGSSQSEADCESESDRQFLEELPETQMPEEYDQSMVYHRSLMSQAVDVPVFKSRPIRRGPFGPASRHVSVVARRRHAMLSSSPVRTEDEYVLGSFVVDDEAEMSYIDESLG